MFSFFTKKEFLVDHLEGFIDIHNHMLPGIDDGAKTVDESIELIKGMGEFGITDFICSPHIMSHYYPNTPETINAALLLLKDELLRKNMKEVAIRTAAEHMIDDNFETILESGEIMPLGDSYLLVEMSFLQASINFDQATKKVMNQGFFPILAHPERYHYLHDNFQKHEGYKNKGIQYQLNLLSLGNYYGKEVQQMAKKLLQKGLIDFVGSDVHNLGQLNSMKEIQVDAKQLKLLNPLLENTNRSFL